MFRHLWHYYSKNQSSVWAHLIKVEDNLSDFLLNKHAAIILNT